MTLTVIKAGDTKPYMYIAFCPHGSIGVPLVTLLPQATRGYTDDCVISFPSPLLKTASRCYQIPFYVPG